MAWSMEISPEFERDYTKLCGRNAAFRHAVDKKMAQIALDPLHYKPLRGPLQGFRRVHVGSSFVMIFQPIEASQVIRFVSLSHHDHAY